MAMVSAHQPQGGQHGQRGAVQRVGIVDEEEDGRPGKSRSDHIDVGLMQGGDALLPFEVAECLQIFLN
eukprot:scaffold279665_cov37-Prasinocladus_malaysianus.AAC.1